MVDLLHLLAADLLDLEAGQLRQRRAQHLPDDLDVIGGILASLTDANLGKGLPYLELELLDISLEELGLVDEGGIDLVEALGLGFEPGLHFIEFLLKLLLELGEGALHLLLKQDRVLLAVADALLHAL